MNARHAVSIAALLLVVLSPSAFASTASAAQIGDPVSDTVQLWTTIAASIDTVAHRIAMILRGQASLAVANSASSREAAAQPASAASAVEQPATMLSTISSPISEPSTSTTTTAASQPTTFRPIIEQVVQYEPLAFKGFITEAELTSQLQQLSDTLVAKFNATSSPPLPQNVAADGNPNVPYAAESNIGNLSNVTITNANLTTSEIPPLGYLSLSGGTLTGPLNVSSLNASSTTFAGFSATNATTTSLFSTNASTTNATSTTLFSSLANFGSAVASTINASIANLIGLTATNATTTNLIATNATTTNLSSANASLTGATANTIQGSGNQASISGFSINGVINPLAYGAKCDGVTDDSAAFQAALNAVGISGNAVLIPPSTSGCLVRSLLTYNSATSGPIMIYGDGPKSNLIVAGTSGGLSVSGNCGASTNAVFLRDFSVTSGAASPPAFAIQLSGLAGYGVDNVDIIGGSQGFTYGIQLSGAQQGYVHGGESESNGTGIYIGDCGGGTVSSNGVDIGDGRTFNDKTAAVDIEGGASDVWIHNDHITSSSYGVINDQTDGAGGFGPNYISQTHLEVNSIYGVDVRSGSVTLDDNNDYNSASLHAASSTRVVANNNLFDGSITLDANSSAVFTNNHMNGAFNDNTSSSNIVQSNNIGNGRPNVAATFNSSGQFTSAGVSAGDILTLAPNSTVGGNWGETIDGAGSGQEVYLRLNDVAIAGSTNGGSLSILSQVGGTQWAQFSNSGAYFSTNVGIGTSSPGSLLSLNNLANFTTATSTFYSAGGINLEAGCFAIAGSCVTGGTNYWSLSGGNLYDSTGNNVGIGTSTPQQKLTVAGGALFMGGSIYPSTVTNLTVTGTSNPLVTVAQDGASAGSAGVQFLTAGSGSYQARIYASPTSGPFGAGLIFERSGTTFGGGSLMAKFDANGNLAIGTSTPYSRLEVFGPDTASTSVLSVVNSASTTEFSVYDNGNAVLAGSLTQNSDERLKTNIQSLDASSSLSLIDQLNPVTFNWIDPNKGTTPQLGFIAQQVLPIFPNLVATTAPTALTPDGTLSLNYIDLVSPIVSAIQALSSEVTSIENTIAGFTQTFTTQMLTAATGHFSNELCVGSTCVTPAQFQAMVAAASASRSAEPSGLPNDDSDASSTPDTPPVIAINGDNPAIVQVGATYNDLGATITGPQADLNLGIATFLNGTLTSNIVIDTSQPATDTIDYVATDQNGLASTSTRTVVVEAAETPNWSSTSATSTIATSSPSAQ